MKNKLVTLKLDEEAVDQIADLITEFCKENQTDKEAAIRYRLTGEECANYWLRNGCRGNELTFHTGKRLLSPFFTIECVGPEGDPFNSSEDEFGMYFGNILVNYGLAPEYTYKKNKNRINIRIQKKPVNSFVLISSMVALGLMFGFLGMYMPDELRTGILNNIITPLYEVFYSLLLCISGPMIFLSVAWGIYGIGDTATFGRIGKKLLLRYVSYVFIASIISAFWYPLVGPAMSRAGDVGNDASSIAELLKGIFPSSIVDPFLTGNTLQIIFLAVVIGIALLALGAQTSEVATFIDQINSIVQYLMAALSKLVPYVIGLMTINIIWSKTYVIFGSIWTYVLASLGALITTSLLFLIAAHHKSGIPAAVILKSCLPGCVISLTTGSSAAAFNSIVKTCTEKFGISPSLTNFGVPLGFVICKPAVAIYLAITSFFLANKYGVTVNVTWLIIAVLVSALIAIAAPPVPGGAVVAFSAIFAQLNIPSEALPLAIAINVLGDFVITAFMVLMIQLSILSASVSLDMADRDILTKQKTA